MKHTLTTLFTLTLLAGCGGNLDQQGAREQAVEHSCDRAQACEKIGSGREYVDRDDCEVKLGAFWNDRWAKDACDGRVRSEDLDLCLGAIDVTLCDNFQLGLALTTAGQCSQERVCSGED